MLLYPISMKTIVFLRKKTDGENSIEELTYSIFKEMDNVEIVQFPGYSNKVKGIIRNILFALKQKADVYHFFSPGDIYCAPFLRGIKIVTWHDVKTEFFTRNPIFKFIKHYMLRYLPMFFCRYITCISENTKNELITYFPLHKNKIKKILNPYNSKIVETKKNYNRKKKILHIGTASRKNLERVIQALEGLDCTLHIVGILSEGQRNLLNDYNIDYINEYDVDFDRIVELYKQCDIVSFPSLYEGFGMPIIEGQATGRPVLTSKSGAIPEIAGDSVLYVDPLDIDSIRKGFIKILSDEKVYDNLVKLGLENVKRFSLYEIRSQYGALYIR